MYRILDIDGGLILTNKGLVTLTPAHHLHSGEGRVKSIDPDAYRLMLSLLQHGPEVLARFRGLVSLLTDIRTKQVSTACGFGHGASEKRQRATAYAEAIERLCTSLDTELREARDLLDQVGKG